MTQIRIPEGMPLPPNWEWAKRYPVVIDGRVRLVPYELARRAVRFSGRCVSEHEDGPPQAQRGSWLCWQCENDFGRALVGIERAWPALQDMLHPSRAGGEVGSKSVDPAVPIALELVPVVAAIEAAVAPLAQQLLEDRPDLQLSRGRTTGEVAGAIGRWHMSWLRSHPSSSLPKDMLVEVWDAYLGIPRDAERAVDVPPMSRWIEHAKARRG